MENRSATVSAAGAIAGPLVTLDLRTFYLRDLTLTGSTVVLPNIFRDLISYIDRAEIKPILAASFKLQDLPKAQQLFIDMRHSGNILVTMD